MSRITVIGATGYAGSAITAEAALRGHEVTALSRTLPATPVAGVRYVQGDATDAATLTAVVDGADVVVAALSPRGPLAGALRSVYGTLVGIVADAGARLVVVGGFTALRPSEGAPRLFEDADSIPEAYRAEAVEMAQFLAEDLAAAPESLDWVYVSPAALFGAHAPGERTGEYRIAGEVALAVEGGPTRISAPDYALAVVDLIERESHHREQVNVAY